MKNLADCYLVTNQNQTQLDFTFNEGLSSDELETIADYIEEHLEQKLSLNELANLLNLSPYHFTRLFQQSVGIAPYQYVVKCRIRRAKNLLRQTDLAIAQIAKRTGFSSHSCFTKAFRKSTAVSPKVYRHRI